MDDFEPKEREKIQMGEMVSSSPSDSRDNSSVIGMNFCTRESHPLAIKMEQVPAAFAADLFCNAHDDLCTVEVEDRPRPAALPPSFLFRRRSFPTLHTFLLSAAKLFGHECQYQEI